MKRLNLPPGATKRARRLRRTMTDAERVLWRALREALPQHHWRKQVPFGAYFADFCSHGAKLIIEVDGGQHAIAGRRDADRTRFLEAEGYRVIRFWNNDVLGNTGGVIELISAASPLVGEVGRGRDASASQKNLSAADAAGPRPNPPHKGEGLCGPKAMLP